MKESERYSSEASKELTYAVIYSSYEGWVKFGLFMANKVYQENEPSEIILCTVFNDFRYVESVLIGKKSRGYIVTTAENIPTLLNNVREFYEADPKVSAMFEEIEQFYPIMENN